MTFLLRAAGWIGVNFMALIAGAVVGAELARRSNVKNDRTIAVLCELAGALSGSSGVIVWLVWRYEKRLRRWTGRSRQDPEP